MPKKLKHPSCAKGVCKEHMIEIIPLSKSGHFKRIQKMRLCPQFNIKNKVFIKSSPILNTDQKFYTPAFILEEDKIFNTEKDERYKNSHMKKVYENPSGISELSCLLFLQLTQLVPNHGRKNKFCNVCRRDFDDYLEHITSENHKHTIRTNKYSSSINQLVKKYAKIRLQNKKTHATNESTLEDSTQVQNLRPKPIKQEKEHGLELNEKIAQLLQVDVKND